MNAVTDAPRKPPVEVAVGVLLRPDGSFLLASRPEGKPYAGYWEFPGGKLEAGENVAQALARELHEELGIRIQDALPWVTIEHVYPHAHVRLHFTRVTRWSGELVAREGQQFEWFDLRDRKPEPLLEATKPCLRWLALPWTIGVSQAAALGTSVFLRRLETALAEGLRALQLREPMLQDEAFAHLYREVRARTQAAGARLIVNSMHGARFWEDACAVHLREQDFAALSARPSVDLVGVSAHARPTLERAAALGLDYAIVGPVCATQTHPDARPLGWDGFAALVTAPGIPVYAIGGLTPSMLGEAMIHGAHGIAMLRAAWGTA